jgi:hypothetical protein
MDATVDDSLNLYDELVLAVHEKKRQQSLESMLAEHCVLGVAVMWEAFVHDLIVSYIEEEPDAPHTRAKLFGHELSALATKLV